MKDLIVWLIAFAAGVVSSKGFTFREVPVESGDMQFLATLMFVVASVLILVEIRDWAKSKKFRLPKREKR